MKEEKQNLKMSDSQITTFAYAIFEDIDKYVDTSTEEYNKWLLDEIITDAVKEVTIEKNKMKNK